MNFPILGKMELQECPDLCLCLCLCFIMLKINSRKCHFVRDSLFKCKKPWLTPSALMDEGIGRVTATWMQKVTDNKTRWVLFRGIRHVPEILLMQACKLGVLVSGDGYPLTCQFY